MATCKLYKGSTLLGSGAITAGSSSVTGWSAQANTPAVARRRVTVAVTSSTHIGFTFQTRVTADNGSGTLTLQDAFPFAT